MCGHMGMLPKLAYTEEKVMVISTHLFILDLIKFRETGNSSFLARSSQE